MAAVVTPGAAMTTVQAKKTRLNPARRKSAANAKAKEVLPGREEITASKAILTTSHRPPPPESAKSLGSVSTHVNSPKPDAPVKRLDGGKAIGPTPKLSPSTRQSAQPLVLAAPAMVTGGLLGCVAGAAILASVGLWHDYAGADSAVLAARAAKLCLDNLADEVISSLKAGTYSTDEALDILRRTSLAYASTVPGGTAYVERIFREVGLVRKHRGQEVDKILSDSYAALLRAGSRGASADQMRGIVMRQLAGLNGFATNSLRDIADRNPSLKPYNDGAAKALQGTPQPKVPTIKLNLTMRSKKAGS